MIQIPQKLKALATSSLLASLLAIPCALQAATVYEDDFTAASAIPANWSVTGSVATFDDPNDQIDYSHTAGDVQRLIDDVTSLVGQVGYLKVTISNYSSGTTWFGFLGDNPGNTTHWAYTEITGNGVYELIINNTTSNQSYDNGSGWSGTLTPGTGVWQIDGGASQGSLTFRSSFPAAGSDFSGFGFLDAGNTSIYPTSAFSIDDILVDDSLSLVVATGNPPVFGSDPVAKPTATAGTPYTGETLDGSATDPDMDSLTYNKVSGPTWLSIASGGALTGTPSALDGGLNEWEISVNDGNGNIVSAMLEITVFVPNQSPDFASDPIECLPAVQDERYASSVIADATDPDGNILTFSIVAASFSGPGTDWLTMDSNGNFYGTPTAANVGTSSWTVEADDGSLTDTTTLEIEVVATAPTFSKNPNVIVIISDDAGYADFGFTDGLLDDGGMTSYHITDEIATPTPNLDALAARGVRFSRAYVAANCQPTRAALATGAYQQRIGNESVGNDLFRVAQQDAINGNDPDDEDVDSDGDVDLNSEGFYEGVPQEVDTVWDRMKSLPADYTTCAIGKWHLGQTASTGTWGNWTRIGNRPQHQGIDEAYVMWHGSRDFLAGSYNQNAVDDPEHALQPRFIRECFPIPLDVNEIGASDPRDATDPDGYDVIVEFSKYADVPSAPQYITSIFNDYAEEFVKEHHDDAEPFFLYLAHPAPHKPWTNESPDYTDPRIAAWPDTVDDGLGGPSGANYRKQVMSMMITMDKEIGELIDILEDPNEDGDISDSIFENTLVIFINDNGGVAGRANNDVNGTSNGHLNGWKGSSKDGGIRVPMLAAGAGIDPSKRGTIYDEVVHGIDILPTAYELGGGSTLTPDGDNVDGVNILPFINGTAAGVPHEVLVHKWRGSFAVLKKNGGDLWKLQNSRNILADPGFYDLWNLNDHPDEEAGDTEFGNPAYASFIVELQRHLTDAESTFSKPRFAIRSNSPATEPINLFNHHVFRPDQAVAIWGGGVDPQEGTGGTRNWYKAGTTIPKFLLNTDCFPNAVLEFPVHTANYTADNDLQRKTGLEFMLNKIVLSGVFNEGSNATATISGKDILFADDLSGSNDPEIAVDATETNTGNFTYDMTLDILLYDDLNLTGDGDATLDITGELTEYEPGFYAPRSITKSGTCTVNLGPVSYTGDTTVDAGTLTLSQANSDNDASTVNLGGGATLNLTYAGTDIVDKLFIGGTQQDAGVYGRIGGGGAANEISQITGNGTLTVNSSPVSGGYAAWAATNASGGAIGDDHDGDTVKNGIEYFMGETGSGFTALPQPDSSGMITWPMGAAYSGVYGTDYYLEYSTPDLSSWLQVPVGQVTINSGTSVEYTLPAGPDPYFVRLVVNAN